ncbi:hypothetical protein PISMIDRAFT_18629 [Pisolithus microcarpus 441]|uniref:Zn(2)-C6 fungal-type domain-containing protein n=1 Tax=Pisolithus microcarpus 441 TaxID=765257 RepID=A0A0C9Y6Q0_9AGAM|nr:hypothetical protein BKA83DRAFT_18629 [Pisolithus microcarpus]KIK12596.1 hypothetical protein PISMIDRAFT_18629 [Pisolithus microcarpus 441]
MFYKTRKELDIVANNIMAIYRRLIGATKHLGAKERYSSWREAVKAMSEELESVRAIAKLTDVMLHTLIGVNKYIRWKENVGSPECPFPSWKMALKPDDADIADHPWLLTAERRFDVHQPKQSTGATLAASRQATPTLTTAVKGKAKEIERPVTPLGIQHAERKADEEDGESEIDTMDQLIDDNDDELNPPRGLKQEHVDELEDDDYGTSKRPKTPTRRISKVAHMQLPPSNEEPPNATSCDTCMYRKIVCVPNPSGGVCKPCKSCKIRCSHSTRSSEGIAVAAPTAVPSTSSTPRRNPSRTRKPARKRSASNSPLLGNEAATPHASKKVRISRPMEDMQGPSAQPNITGRQQDWAIIVPLLKSLPTRTVPPARGNRSTKGMINEPSHDGPQPNDNQTDCVNDPSDAQAGSISREGDLPGRMVNIEVRLDALERWPQQATLGLLENRVKTLEDQVSGYQIVMASMAREIEMLRAHIETQENALLETKGDSAQNGDRSELEEMPVAPEQPTVSERIELLPDRMATVQDMATAPLDTMDIEDGRPAGSMDVEVAVEASGSGEGVDDEGNPCEMQDTVVGTQNIAGTDSPTSPTGDAHDTMSPPPTEVLEEPVLDCPIATVDDGNCGAEELDCGTQPVTLLPANPHSPPHPNDTTMQEAGQDPHPTSTSHSPQAEGGSDCHATSVSQAHQGDASDDGNISTGAT